MEPGSRKRASGPSENGKEEHQAGCTVYVWVSNSRQVKLQTIEQQPERVRKHVLGEGRDLPEENVFRDDGYSGTLLKRPGLDALRDRVRVRDLEVVVVLSPDRLAGNYVHQMVLIEELQKGGCRVEFVERPMNSEPNDQLLLQIRGVVAEYERTLLSERMRRGRLAEYKAGLLLPWTTHPIGHPHDSTAPLPPEEWIPVAAVPAVVSQQQFDLVEEKLSRNKSSCAIG